jgi:putative hydrolase of the HAD superfamily
VVSDGRSVKQWQKLIQLGVHHLFHSVVISEDVKDEKLSTKPFKKCLDELSVKPKEAVYVSARPNKEILCANEVGIITVRMRQGDTAVEEPMSQKAKAVYEISQLSEIIETLDTL